ncbi:TlpA disulfide reductase family protein [Pedobacter hiemivivus]|nr:TlpA disulfide reductase family protein [Pedobacter hiemivivus]
MRTTTILSLLLLTGTLAAQVKKPKGFTLNGHLANAASKMVYFSDGRNTAEKVFYMDSTLTDAMGRFTFKGIIAEPRQFLLQVKNAKRGAIIYMENANILIEGNADSLTNVRVKGAKEEAIRQEWMKLNDPVAQKKWADEISRDYDTAVERKDSAAMKLEKEKLGMRYTENLIKKIKTIVDKYPNSVMSVDLIGFVATFQENHTADSLLKVVEQTTAGRYTQTKELRKQLNITLSQTIGSKAPDFLQPDTAGKLISLSSMKGKYVLLDFWASWCTPCRAENPYLLKAYARFKDKGFTILSVSLDGDRKAWLSAVKHDNLLWPQVGDLKAAANEVAKSYGVRGIPANFLIDPQGKIVAKNLRGDKLEKQLEKLF